ncbi:MAG: hypothetical protein ACM3WV_02750 [Bacillota bacterium]
MKTIKSIPLCICLILLFSIPSKGDGVFELDFEWNPYLETGLKYSEVNGYPAPFLGISAGAAFDNVLSVGGGFYCEMNASPHLPPGAVQYCAHVFYTGLTLECVNENFFQRENARLVYGGLLGIGVADIKDLGSFDDRHRAFFLFEPEVKIETDLSDNMRLNLGLSHKYAAGINTGEYIECCLSGTSFSAGIRYRLF